MSHGAERLAVAQTTTGDFGPDTVETKRLLHEAAADLVECEQKIATLNVKLQAASLFIRDILEALGREQPPVDAIVNLPDIALQVVGQIEQYKTEATAAEARILIEQGRYRACRQDLDDVEARFTAQAAHLREYGRHKVDCSRRRLKEGTFIHAPCTCGFDGVLNVVDHLYGCGCYLFSGNLIACPEHSPEQVRISARVRADQNEGSVGVRPECDCDQAYSLDPEYHASDCAYRRSMEKR